jgi:hypothetical protein
MGDDPTIGETRAERIKRKWDEGEPERAARRAEREAARPPEREAFGLLRRMGQRAAGQVWRLLLTLVILAVAALPGVVVWALVGSDAGAKVLGGTIALVVVAIVIVMSAGTKYSGDW